jgi:hypothetical protein
MSKNLIKVDSTLLQFREDSDSSFKNKNLNFEIYLIHTYSTAHLQAYIKGEGLKDTNDRSNNM